MKTTTPQIKVGIATEEQVNQEFIAAWHRAEQNTGTTPEERLYFQEPETLFKVLSASRLAILFALSKQEVTNIQSLSQQLRRNYKNVYRDVQLLKKAGLIHQTNSKELSVPWDKIQTEIDLKNH